MIESGDLIIIGFLIFLEGILSIDNALVIAILARPLPPEQRRKALTYGIAGAVVFRILAISLAAYLIDMVWVKFIGGGYLVLISVKSLFFKGKEGHRKSSIARSFWKTVVVIELTDIAFAVDSILAAVALTPKVWVIVTGGIIGLIIMRFAAAVFIKLLDRFPAFEITAYLLVFIIGVKVILEGFQLPGLDFHSAKNPAFWVFWSLMALGVLSGFRPKKHS